MPKKEIYHSGHDIKSLLINLATLLFFFLPFGLYYYPEYKNEQYMAIAASFLITYLTPPIGFLRPHPYTDKPANKPFAPRLTFTKTSIKQK